MPGKRALPGRRGLLVYVFYLIAAGFSLSTWLISHQSTSRDHSTLLSGKATSVRKTATSLALDEFKNTPPPLSIEKMYPRAKKAASARTNQQQESLTSESSSSSSSSPQQPLFVMHVGITKTATSTLQHVMERYSTKGTSNTTALLAQDNWYYAGKVLGANVRDYPILNALSTSTCRDQVHQFLTTTKKKNAAIVNLLETNSERMPECWISLLSTLEELHKRRINVLLSEENLSVLQLSLNPLEWKWMKAALAKFRVKVVISYRRWPEWVASSKNEVEKPSPAKRRRLQWPDQGGLATAPLWHVIRNILSGTQPPYFPYADTVLAFYQKHFDNNNVVVLNYHAGDIVSNFCCNILNATISCQVTLDHARRSHYYLNHSRTNKRVDMHYDMLATAAASAGLVNTTKFTRSDVVEAIRIRQSTGITMNNQTMLPWPLDCPTKTELQPILDKSLDLEQKIVGSEWFESHREDHVQAFWRMAFENNLFCSPNTRVILKDRQWLELFQKHEGDEGS